MIINQYLNLNLNKIVIKINYLRKKCVVESILILQIIFHLKKKNVVVIFKINKNLKIHYNNNYCYKTEKKILIY